MKTAHLSLAIIALFALSACGSLQSRSGTPKKSVVNEALDTSKRPEAGPRKRVLILPFLDANPERSPEFREKARQAFMIELNRSGQLLAVDANELKNPPSKTVQNGEYQFGAMSKDATELGVAVMLEGKIIDIRVKRSADNVGIIRQVSTAFEAVVRVRMASVRGGREIFNTVKTVTVEQSDVRVAERVENDRFIRENPQLLQTIVKDAFLDFAPQIVSALSQVGWEGRIAALNGDRIYLNVGRQSGLQVGDLLKVTEEGEEIFDPESGHFIGRVPGRMKGTLEVISYFGSDGAISIIHSGAGFRENDRVEFYQ